MDYYYNYEGTCMHYCPNATYERNFICYDCSQDCAHCVNEKECEDCDPGFYLHYLSSTQIFCVDECPAKYFPTNTTCEMCGSNCYTCDDEETCT